MEFAHLEKDIEPKEFETAYMPEVERKQLECCNKSHLPAIHKLNSFMRGAGKYERNIRHNFVKQQQLPCNLIDLVCSYIEYLEKEVYEKSK